MKTKLQWITCGPYAGCLQVAKSKNRIFIRDSTRPRKIVEVTKQDWQVFVRGVKEDRFDTL